MWFLVIQIGELSSPIRCIILRDKATDGTGGFAIIKEGGINYRHVVVHFKSQRGSDIRFTIDIYAEQNAFVAPMYPGVVSQPGWIYPNQQQQYTFNRV